MTAKGRIIGLVLIIVGALPFLLKVEAINSMIGKYTFLLPGEIIYQAIIIVLGVLLIVGKKRQQYNYRV